MVRRLAAQIPGHSWLPARSLAHGSHWGGGGGARCGDMRCPVGPEGSGRTRRGWQQRGSDGRWSGARGHRWRGLDGR